MTIEEAIKQLTCDRDLFNFNPWTGEPEAMSEENRKSAEAIDMAIHLLKTEHLYCQMFSAAVYHAVRSNLPKKTADVVLDTIADYLKMILDGLERYIDAHKND